MKIQKAFCVLVIATAFVAGDTDDGISCNSRYVRHCYQARADYQSVYSVYLSNGKDDIRTKRICRGILARLNCFADYLNVCNNTEKCDQWCQKVISALLIDVHYAGIPEILNEICIDPSRERIMTALFAGDADVGRCDSGFPKKCLERLKDYETNFPFYGKEEFEMLNNRFDIFANFHCIATYAGKCNNTEKCDGECQKTISTTMAYIRKLGFPQFIMEVRDPGKTNYLTHYECLKSNKDVYSACNENAVKSKKYLETQLALMEKKTIDPESYRNTVCCFASWYPSCYSNVTYKRCGTEAGQFIDNALKDLMDKIDHDCNGSSITCDAPPLPEFANCSSTLFQALATSVISFFSIMLLKFLL